MDSVEHREALDLVHFWLRAGPVRWFDRNDGFDEACRGWVNTWERACKGYCDDWARTATGSLALIILFDQIPRNSFRGLADQFASDDKALAAADAAVAAGHDRSQVMPVQNFFYLPYQHAEDLAAQERGLDLYRVAGDQNAYFYALVHADAIRRFGRFPHRNPILGRESTAEEIAYMESGGFAN
ncbi:DUF924 family protein [Acuticoccus sp. M5D2P5]|uniref:DUF924 family protein n=1 Tax=Acuticoccus kalidii TaxID=2910977 RepID=UPI001F193ECD|nr:DUF924 family protein [Acuticoccus kalidii]MCF3932184.1 DUF924 family protein [Acuticoccus kalidii]